MDNLVSILKECRSLSLTAGSAVLRKAYYDASVCFERASRLYNKGSYSLARTAATQGYNSIDLGFVTDSLENIS